jgi:hypothetical protein
MRGSWRLLAQRPGVDVEPMARAMLAFAESALHSILTDTNEFTPQHYTEFLRDVLVRLTA